MKNQRKIGVLLSYITLFANSLIGIIYTPFMTSTLGQAEYGIYQLVASFSSYLIMVDFGTATTITRYLSKYRAQQDKQGEENFLSMMLVQTTILSLIAIVAGTAIYFSLDTMFATSLTASELATAKKLFLVMIINVAVALFSHVWRGITTADERFVYNNGTKLIRIFLRMGLITVLLLLGMGSLALVLVDLIVGVIFISCDIFVSLRISKASFRFHFFDKPLFKETFLFSSFILLQALINQLNSNAPKTVLGILLSPEAVAVYAVAMQIFMIYNSLSTTVSSVFLPKATRLVCSDADETQLTNLVITPGRLQFMVLGIALVGFSVVGQDFIYLWMGNEYKDAWLISLLVMIPSTVELIESVAVSIVLAKNKNGFRTITLTVVSVLSVALSVLLIKMYGIIGAPISLAVSHIVGYGIILNIYYKKAIGLQIGRMFKEIAKGTLPALVVTTIATIPVQIWIQQRSWIIFVVKAIYMLAIYTTCMLLFGMNDTERQLVKNLLRKLKISRQDEE